MKGFSVIIPTLNRTDYLLNTLKYLSDQEFEFPYEVLIIDQSKEVDSKVVSYSEDYENLKYHYITSFRGLPEARNFGVSKSEYDYILFLDDDIECYKTLLKEHYIYLSKDDIGIVAGGVTEKNNPNVGNKIGKFNEVIAQPVAGFHNDQRLYVDHAKGCNFSVKKKLFIELNGIDISLTKGAALYEELDFCLRLRDIGYKIFFNYNAHVNHLAATTGGCRVPKIDKYIFSLARNRTIIINRHLPWYYKFTSRIYLFKLMISYFLSYRDSSILKSYYIGVKEGKKIEKCK